MAETIDLRGKDAPKPEDYMKTGETLAAGLGGGLQGAVAGAQVGALAGPAGAPIGAMVGGLIGFMGGAIGAEKAQQQSLSAAIDAYKSKKDVEKLAGQQLKTERRQQKRKSEADRRGPGLTPIADIRDVMSFTPGAGITHFDEFERSTYGKQPYVVT